MIKQIQKQKLPNFLIIGAAHSGTTALYYYLNQHPQIYMSPIKETNYFAFEGENLDCYVPFLDKLKESSARSLEEYLMLFKKVSNEIAIGEASPIYLISPGAAQRIQDCIPNVKLIAILRDPVERLYSGVIRISGEQAIADLYKALNKKYFLKRKEVFDKISTSLFYDRLKQYFNLFKREQIRVYLYEQLCNGSEYLIQDIFQFLEVDSKFVPDIVTRYNSSGLRKNTLLRRIIYGPQTRPIKLIAKRNLPSAMLVVLAKIQHNFNQQNLLKPPPLPLELRRQLIQTYYREDILKLEDLLQRDLSKWLE